MVTGPVLRRRRCVVAYGAQHLLREAEEVGVVQGLLRSLQRQLAAVGTVDVPVAHTRGKRGSDLPSQCTGLELAAHVAISGQRAGKAHRSSS